MFRPSVLAAWLCLLALPLRADDRLVLPVDDEVPAQLKRLDQLASQGEWDRVIAGLDALLAGGGGILLPGDPPQSARAEARRRLLALPEAARASYADLHEPAARRLLVEGIDRADPSPLEAILALHPATSAAPLARRALVDIYAERGQPAAALVHLEALLEGQPSPEERPRLLAARALLLALTGRPGEAREALDALPPDEARQALQARMAASGPPRAPDPPPGDRVAWVSEVVGYFEERGETDPKPWTIPQVDVVWAYGHDGSHALARDLRTGKVRWRTALRPGADAFVPPGGLCRTLLVGGTVLCALPAPQPGLVALDRQTGRLRWRRSLNELKAEGGLELPASLAAAPIALGETVILPLVTGHGDREVHLLAVDAGSGRALWHLFLCGQTGGRPPELVLAVGPARALVVTGLGAVAAVDARGELLWLRRYRSLRDKRPERPANPFNFGGDEEQDEGPPPRDPTALVHRGLLWCAPSDAEGVFVFDARTGEPRGDLPGDEHTRLIGPRGSGVIAYAKGQVQQIERSGVQRLTKLSGLLRGRPCVAGDKVLIPLDEGLFMVDPESGHAERCPAFRDEGSIAVAAGRIVVAAKGAMVALGAPPADDLPSDAPPLQALGSASPARRAEARAALLRQGEAARGELATAVHDSPDPEVRLCAGQLLAELDRAEYVARWTPLIKPAWEQAVPTLLARLTHVNPEQRLKALSELGDVQGDPDVLVLLRDLLGDPDLRVRRVVAISLLHRGDRGGMPVLEQVLREGGDDERLMAVQALVADGQAQDVSRLLACLEDPAGPVRAAAAAGALKLGGEGVLPRVAPLMSPQAPEEVRLAILDGVLALSQAQLSPAGLAVLVEASRDANDEVRLRAVTALARDGVRDPLAYRALGAVLGDSVREIAHTAAARLHKVAQRQDVLLIPADGLEKGAALPDATQRLHVSDIAIQYAVQGGVLTVPTLVRFMLDPEPQVREIQRYWRAPSWADLLLRRAEEGFSAGDVATIQSLTLAEHAHVRHNGFWALAKAPAAPGRGPLLVRAIDDADEEVRRNAPGWLVPDQGEDRLDGPTLVRLFQLAALSPTRAGPVAEATLARVPPARLIPLLVPLVQHRDPVVRDAAGARLGALPGAPAWDPQGDPRRQAEALAGWWWSQSHPDRKVEDLIRDLVAENPSLRWRAAQEAATLPTFAVRGALVGSLQSETMPWVLKEKLAALVAITGEQQGFDPRGTPEQLRACAQRFQAWLSRKLAEELGGPR